MSMGERGERNMDHVELERLVTQLRARRTSENLTELLAFLGVIHPTPDAKLEFMGDLLEDWDQ